MKSLPIIALAFLSLALTMQVSKAAEECLPDDVKTSRADAIYVSEFAISLGESACPTSRLPLEPPVVAKGKRVQFWFRIQGSLGYLSSRTSRRPFDIRFFKKESSGRIFFDAIAVPPVTHKRAVAEANDNQGRFDWRLFVRKRVFITPGTYVVTLSQGNTDICFEKNSGPLDCEKEFTVKQ